jgi:alpha,alpha-trehalase
MDWHWHYHDYQPEQERLREALCTLGNGYFATRGGAPEADAGAHHYLGTYLAGGYDRAETEVQGRVVENEDPVNLPNWLPLRLSFDDSTRFALDEVDILSYRQSLDMRRGLLVREVRFSDARGPTTRLRQRWLVHLALHHLGALDTGRHTAAATRQRGHRLQRLAVLPSHRRQRVPGLLRSRNAA